MSDSIQDFAIKSNAWPFVEARALMKRVGQQKPKKGYVLFETGYGPSGFPHIGTFGEVARTAMVQHAFEVLTGLPTKLVTFSDDMDAFRKVPDNLPEQKMLANHLGKPLIRVPDPFSTHESLGHHNNARLCAFLDRFNFDYDFRSSTEYYTSGAFDVSLLAILQNYDEILHIILPTLGQERRATYSPFLPICPKTGIVLQARVIERDVKAGTIIYEDPKTKKKIETPVTGGCCKLQWKADWAMRWTAFNVDYEMAGKDLIDSVVLSSKICRVLGGYPPSGFFYELFLDQNGEKISKSKGNGLTMEEWLTYAPPESLALFMFQKPKTAKRLFFDVIPRNVDEYLNAIEQFPNQNNKQKIENPVWHVHRGKPLHETIYLSYNSLLNLASVCHSEDPKTLWHYISRYVPEATPKTAPFLNKLVGYAIDYYRDFVKPGQCYRQASEAEKAVLKALIDALQKTPDNAKSTDFQNTVYKIGKAHPEVFGNLKEWFKALYQILLGQEQGPRMGSFIALYGKQKTIALLTRSVAGEDLTVE